MKTNKNRISTTSCSGITFWCICLLLSLSSGLRGQYNTNFLNYNLTGRCVSVGLDFEAGSNGISSELVNKLVWGGHIDNKIKDQSAKLLGGKNNFGLLLNYDLSAFLKGGKKFDYLIGFKNQEVLNATFTRDFFNLMFYGNSMYKGQTANLGGCNVNALRFQEVKFGAMIHHVDSLGKIGISISFIKGEQLFFVKTTDKSSLYTSADGSEIVFNSNFSMALSDTNNRRLAGFNGVGASADIFFETPYRTRGGQKCVLAVNANNLGFIHWWNNSVQYSSDSTLRYTGYNVRTLTDLKDSTISRINGDSLLRDIAHARTENFNVNIPTNLLIINRVYFGSRYCLGAGFRYIFNANYRPYLFLEPEVKIKNVYWSLHVGYGGYTNLNVGTALTWSSKGWFMKLGSNSLQGFIFPKLAFGQGIFVAVAKKLK